MMTPEERTRIKDAALRQAADYLGLCGGYPCVGCGVGRGWLKGFRDHKDDCGLIVVLKACRAALGEEKGEEG